MVVLTILKVIGWILLSLVGLMILIVSILLLSPVTYSLEGQKKPGAAWVTVRAGWLFNLVRFRLSRRGGEQTWSLKAAWKTVASEPPVERKPKRKKRTKKDEPSEVHEEPPATFEEPPAGGRAEEPDSSQHSGKAMDSEETPGSEDSPKAGWTSGIRAWKNKLLGFWEKLDTIKQEIENYPEKMETFTVLRGFVGKIVRALLPRKLRVCVHFGLENPAATGYVLGLYYMIMPFLPVWQMEVLPNFQETILEAEAEASGWLTMGHLLWYTFWTYRDKHTRDLIAYIRNKKN